MVRAQEVRVRACARGAVAVCDLPKACRRKIMEAHVIHDCVVEASGRVPPPPGAQSWSSASINQASAITACGSYVVRTVHSEMTVPIYVWALIMSLALNKVGADTAWPSMV